MQRENALDAFAVGDATYGESLVYSPALAGDDDTREDLDALLVAFAHLGVHADAVADLEGGDVRLQLRSGDLFNDGIHDDGF